MIGAEVLEREFEVIPYTSRAMVRAVLSAIRLGTCHDEASATQSEAPEGAGRLLPSLTN